MYGPNIHSIPSHSSFDEALARGLVARYGQDPELFSEGLILVADDSVQALIIDALEDVGPGVPPPRFAALGNEDAESPLLSLLDGVSADDFEPAVAPMARRMSLAKLIRAAGTPVDNAEALRLGQLIALVIDEMHAGEMSPVDAINYLASDGGPPRLGQSFDLALEVIERWQAEILRLGLVDPAMRRAQILERLRQQWREKPPSYFVCAADIVAGGHATARLLRAISDLPQGLVVWSGLSLAMHEREWSALQLPADRWKERWLGRRPRSPSPETIEPRLKPVRRGNRGRDVALNPHGPTLASSGTREAAASTASGQDAPAEAMRFQANSSGKAGSFESERDRWLADQSAFLASMTAEPHDAAYALEDDDGDHPDDWADEPDEAMGGLPFDPAWDGDDPTEEQEEFDDELDGEGWTAPSIAAHPQYHFKKLLEQMGVDRGEVRQWHRSSTWRAPPARSRAISNAFDLPEVLARWTMLPHSQRNFSGVRAFEAPSPEHEALAIAITLRDTGAKPERPAALLTPDAALARRVLTICQTWQLDIDNHVGEPLSLHPVAVLLLSIAHAVTQAFDPPSLLRLLENPLVRCDRGSAAWSQGLRALSAAALDPAPDRGLDTLEIQLLRHRHSSSAVSAIRTWWQQVHAVLSPLNEMASKRVQNIADLVAELGRSGERLCGPELWRDEPGRVARALLTELECYGRNAGTRIEVLNFEMMFRQLLDEKTIGSGRSRRSRLSILTPQNARVHTPALMVVAGLNELNWPSINRADPWISEPMRHDAGLPSLSGRRGLWTHAMAQALGAPEVLLTRSIRDRGRLNRPSQLWLRLEALSGGLRRANEFDDLPYSACSPRRHGLRNPGAEVVGGDGPGAP